MKKVLSLGLAGFATAAIGVLAPAGSASAAAACDTVLSGVPAKVSINRDYENVKWKLTVSNPPPIGDPDDAPLYTVWLEHRDTGVPIDARLVDVNARTRTASGALELYADARPGWYRVFTDNYGCGNSPNQWVKVKFAGAGKTYASRSGSSVTVTGAAYRYVDFDGYQRKAGVPVQLQRYAAGKWTTIKSGKTGAMGTLSVRVKASSAASYRTVVAETTVAWGAVSPTVRK